MSASAPEFTAPQPANWAGVQPEDAPAFTSPQREKRKPIFGGARKIAESKDKPPTRRKAAPRKTVPASKPGEFTEDLMQMYGMVAMGVMLKDPECGKVIMKQGAACAEAWDKLAEDNDQVRKVLRALTAATGLSAVIAAHVPIAMAVMAHHGPGFGWEKGEPEDVADDKEDEPYFPSDDAIRARKTA